MKKFIKNNWFKIIVSFFILLIAISISYYFVVNPYLEKESKAECIEFYLKNLKEAGNSLKFDSLEKINDGCSDNGPLFFLFEEKNKISNNKELRKCNFDIANLKKYRGSYGPNQNDYLVFEGIIKNNLDTEENLKAMIVKNYNKDNMFISEGFLSINKNIKPGFSISFKVHTLIPKEYKAYKNDEIISDIYPWFLTCQ